MTQEEIDNLVKMGKQIDIKVTPIEIDGKMGVAYMDFESFTYTTVLRDLLAIKGQKEARS